MKETCWGIVDKKTGNVVEVFKRKEELTQSVMNAVMSAEMDLQVSVNDLDFDIFDAVNVTEFELVPVESND